MVVAVVGVVVGVVGGVATVVSTAFETEAETAFSSAVVFLRVGFTGEALWDAASFSTALFAGLPTSKIEKRIFQISKSKYTKTFWDGVKHPLRHLTLMIRIKLHVSRLQSKNLT